MSLIPSFVSETRWRNLAWVPPLLFLAGIVVLLSDALNRRVEDREASLAQLSEEVATAAERLESLLVRVSEEVIHYSGSVEGRPNLPPSEMVSAISFHLADLRSPLVGVAFQDPSGEYLETTEGYPVSDSLAGLLLVEGGSDGSGPRVAFHTEFHLPDGRSVTSLSQSVTAERGGRLGYLHVLLSLDRFPFPREDVAPAGDSRTLLLVDSSGTLLIHPNKEWIGYLILTEADSLFDPGLLSILPEVLTGDGGSWGLTSETLLPGSYSNGTVSLLAISPVRLPGGGEWRFGSFYTPEMGFLPGLPPVISVGLGKVLLAMSLVAAAFLMMGRCRFSPVVDSLRQKETWLRALMEAGADGLVVLRGGHGIVVANEEFSRMVGQPQEALKGIPFRGLLETQGMEKEAEGSPLRPGRFEARLQAGKGGRVEVEINSGPFEYDGEEFLLATVRDVSWNRRRERETLRVGEQERLLLGKELHDGLGQQLTGVAFMARTLARKLVERGVREAEEVEEMVQLLKDAVGQVRTLAKGLELSEYEGEDLPRALEEMAGVVRRLMGVNMEMDLPEGLGTGNLEMSRAQATQLFRICHDVIGDAVRNRVARNIIATMKEQEGFLILTIRHDGSEGTAGDPLASAAPSYRLQYRARLLDGVLEVQEDPKTGGKTTCSFKLREVGDEQD